MSASGSRSSAVTGMSSVARIRGSNGRDVLPESVPRSGAASAGNQASPSEEATDSARPQRSPANEEPDSNDLGTRRIWRPQAGKRTFYEGLGRNWRPQLYPDQVAEQKVIKRTASLNSD